MNNEASPLATFESSPETETTSSSPFSSALSTVASFVCRRPFRASLEQHANETALSPPIRASQTRAKSARPAVSSPAPIRRSARNRNTASVRPGGSLASTALPSSRFSAARKRPDMGTRTNLKSPPISRKKQRTSELKSPPANLKNDADYEDTKPPAKPANSSDCCICMTEPESHQQSTVDGCDHQFCFECIATWSDRENTCPLCKSRFTKITRCHPVAKAGRGEKKMSNTKTVKNKDQRSDMVFAGRALEGLLASISARGGGVRAFHAGQSFAGRIVFESRVGGFGSMFAVGDERRQMMFGGLDSDDDDESDFLFSGLGGFMPPSMPRRASREGATAAAATRGSTHDAAGSFHPMVHFRSSSRMRAVPLSATTRNDATTARLSALRGARMSVPSMIHVERSVPAASSNQGEIGASATRPFEIDDDSDDEVEVVEDPRST